MNKEKLFTYLQKQTFAKLIELLDNCYRHMNSADIRSIFGEFEEEFLSELTCEGKEVLKSIQDFVKNSLRGCYYAPFDINSKNYTHVPEETSMWFEKLSELLIESEQLTKQGDDEYAVKCFSMLYELINKMEDGDEVVFADELGMWMLPIEEEPCIEAYIKSVVTIGDLELFFESVLPLIQYKKETYKKIISAANKKQKDYLKKQISQLNFKLY